MPAFDTTRSKPPQVCATISKAFWTESSLLTSISTGNTLWFPISSESSRAKRSAPGRFISAIQTIAPESASPRAISAPKPCAPPVTNEILPFTTSERALLDKRLGSPGRWTERRTRESSGARGTSWYCAMDSPFAFEIERSIFPLARPSRMRAANGSSAFLRSEATSPSSIFAPEASPSMMRESSSEWALWKTGSPAWKKAASTLWTIQE